ncbi:MAG: hypothetical protein MUF54_02105, partial [Polyangiaceae bacterium]|nr:hypothetical protein [Polyangiaceae bacterium]
MDTPERSAEEQLEMLGDVAVLHLAADAFVDLEPRQRVVAYHLGRAAVLGDPILWAQRTAHGLELKQLVEAVASVRASLAEPLRGKVERFAQQIVLHKGVVDTWTGRKLAFELTPDELRQASIAARRARALPPAIATGADLDRLLAVLRPVLFDPDVGTTRPAPHARATQDELRGVVDELRAAQELADPPGKQAIKALADYLTTREPSAQRRYSAAFVADNAPVQAAIGFFDTHGALADSGAFSAGVFLVSAAQSEVYAKLGSKVASMAEALPWPQGHRLPTWG